MLKNRDIYDLREPITIVIFNESLQTCVYILPVGQCTPDKNVTYVSDVVTRQQTTSLTIQSPYEVMYGHCLPQCTCKVDQK